MHLVHLSQEKIAAIEQKLQETIVSHADKVEKGLLKNLVIGYMVAPQNDKLQILKLISAVLEFDQHEINRVGLNRHQTGWLDSIRNAALAVGGPADGKYIIIMHSHLTSFKTYFLEQKPTTKKD